LDGGKKRACVRFLYRVVVSSVSRMFQGLSALYMTCIRVCIYNYNRTTKESKHDRVALAGTLRFCALAYTMKNILYRLYIVIYGLSKLTVVTGLPFAVSVSKNLKPMTLVEVSERHSSPHFYTSQPHDAHVVHVNTTCPTVSLPSSCDLPI